jgi:hypothetical protein
MKRLYHTKAQTKKNIEATTQTYKCILLRKVRESMEILYNPANKRVEFVK